MINNKYPHRVYYCDDFRGYPSKEEFIAARDETIEEFEKLFKDPDLDENNLYYVNEAFAEYYYDVDTSYNNFQLAGIGLMLGIDRSTVVLCGPNHRKSVSSTMLSMFALSEGIPVFVDGKLLCNDPDRILAMGIAEESDIMVPKDLNIRLDSCTLQQYRELRKDGDVDGSV